MSATIGSGDGLMPATYQVPVDKPQDDDALYWLDSSTRWHLGSVAVTHVKAVCGTQFDHPNYLIPRDGNPSVHADLPMCIRCDRIDSKDDPT